MHGDFQNPMNLKMRDGKGFKYGMNVVFESGRELTVTKDDFELCELKYQNKSHTMLRRKVDGVSFEYHLELLYSCQQARIEEQVKQLEATIVSIKQDIEYIRNGGDPRECDSLHINYHSGS